MNKKQLHTIKYAFLTLTALLFAMSVNANQTLPINIKNTTNIANDDNIYVFVKGLDSVTGQTCAVKFDQSGNGQCITVNSNTDLSSYNYKLTDFPSNNATPAVRQLFLPKMSSGRMYISLASPMISVVNSDNPAVLTIPDSDGFKTRDPNYYTLYDKIEFSYNDSGSWVNPTAVDFFSLPIGLQQASSQSLQQSGFNQSARKNILQTVNNTWNIASQKSPSTINQWQRLNLTYQGAMQDGSEDSTVLRVMAPGKAMQVPSALSQNIPFDTKYLDDKSQLSFSYIEQLWSYYKSNTIKIDVSELKNQKGAPILKSYMFTGSVDSNNNFIFNNGTDANETVTLAAPQSISFFAGAVGSFDAKNNTPKAIIIRQLTSAFEVGMLPAPNDIVLDKNYFTEHQSAYFNDDPLLAAGNTGPWYDLYSRALHSIQPVQPIYTFAYDDALGQDGTLVDPNADNIGTVTLTLGDMTGTKIPAPTVDNKSYNLTVYLGQNNSKNFYKLTINGKTVLPGAPLQLQNVKAPLNVSFNNQNYQVYLAHPMFVPYQPITDSIVVDNSNLPNVTLAFPGPPN